MNQDNAIKDLLRTSRVIAVVGLSADGDKPSNVVARYLMDKGYRVIPVNPAQEIYWAKNRISRSRISMKRSISSTSL